MSNRLNQLDGLRGLAAIIVMLYHFTARYDQVFAFQTPLPFETTRGRMGVDLFFIISGYVIFMTLDHVKSARDFLVSRFSRLFPVFWVAVLLTWLLWRFTGWPALPTGLRDLAYNFTMMPEQFKAEPISSVYWSLREELFFYMLMLCLWLLGWLRKPAVFIGAWLLLALLNAALYRFLDKPLPYTLTSTLILQNISCFMIGVLIYVHQQGRISKAAAAVLLALALPCGALYPSLHDGWPAAATTLLWTAAVWAAARGRLPFAGGPWLVFFGAISYPLYLIHEPLGWVIIHALDGYGLPVLVSIICATCTSVLLGYLLHKLVEMPAMRWLRRTLNYGANKTAATPSAAPTPRPVSRTSALAQPNYPAFAACAVAIAALAFAPRIFAPPAATAQPLALNAPPAQRQSDCANVRGVLLVLGQSNAGSHAPASPPQTGAIEGARVFAGGHCTALQDPLPGTTGNGASVWSALAQALSPAQRAELLIAPVAIENTAIAQWVRSGPVHTALRDQLAQVAKLGLPVRAVLWQQGETDMWLGTEARHYKRDLGQLRSLLDSHGITAPLFTATSTFCKTAGAGNVRRALAQVYANQALPRTAPGPDTDTLRGSDRVDDCHFSETGRTQAAQLWLQTLRQAGIAGL